jgi:dTDP-4-amino-4,6-dideoxygalactose transaminase
MKNRDSIPFLDLVTPHIKLKKGLMTVLSDAIDSGSFVGGPAVERFEREFAAFCGTAFCVGVGSGTDALRFALLAAVPAGSIVITVPNTFIATTEAISQAGAIPHFVDVEERTLNMDPKALEKYLTLECYVSPNNGGQTIHYISGRVVSAIVPVHLYGQPADMDSLQALADAYHLKVFEDACQAHGSSYFSNKKNKWCQAGTMSTAAAFSFYPGKNLGALGEGGAVVTDDPAIAVHVRLLREHGSVKKYHHPMEGYNGRLDALQAGFLSEKLPALQESNAQRRRCAVYYDKILANLPGLETPYEAERYIGNWHLYVVRTEFRDEMQARLADRGIATGRHYPLPLHRQPAYRHLDYGDNRFPVVEMAAQKILSLPMFPSLTQPQQDRVASEIIEFLDHKNETLMEGVGAKPVRTDAS